MTDLERSTPLFFVSDPSAEAERLAQALRGEGYSVVDVPSPMLIARVAVQPPIAVFVDGDTERLGDLVERLRELPDGEALTVVLLGATPEDVEATSESGVLVFPRPLDVGSVLARARELVRVERPSIPSPASSASNPASVRPVPLAQPSVPSLVPPPPPSLRGLHEPMSSELSRLLGAAEERVANLVFETVPPSPIEELEAVLPEEYLRSLDAPIDAIEEELYDGGQSPHGRSTTSAGGNRSTTGGGTGAGISSGTGVNAPSVTGAPSGGTNAGTDAGSSSMTASPASLVPMLVEHPQDAQVTVQHRLRNAAPREASDPPKPALVQNSTLSSADLGPLLLANRPMLPLDAPSPGTATQSSAPATITDPLDGARILANAIVQRLSGSLSFQSRAEDALRRVLLRDGDLLLVTSSLESECLVSFLVERGDISADRKRDLVHTLPPFGKRAVAPLVARGLLARDQMWNVLRAHAEWVLGRTLAMTEGSVVHDPEIPARLRDEDPVFGGSTGAEVFVDVSRRVLSTDVAVTLLGGPEMQIVEGPHRALSTELRGRTSALIEEWTGESLARVVEAEEPDSAALVWALAQLGILELRVQREVRRERPSLSPSLDLEAVRERVRARRAVVDNGDYFAVLGVPREATGYEIRRAFLELRRSFEPSKLLTTELADLLPDVRRIVVVLEEAYDILKDEQQRKRYRQAIESSPVSGR